MKKLQRPKSKEFEEMITVCDDSVREVFKHYIVSEDVLAYSTLKEIVFLTKREISELWEEFSVINTIEYGLESTRWEEEYQESFFAFILIALKIPKKEGPRWFTPLMDEVYTSYSDKVGAFHSLWLRSSEKGLELSSFDTRDMPWREVKDSSINARESHQSSASLAEEDSSYWRLPTIEELIAMYDKNTETSISGFKLTPYWSSTKRARYENSRWVVTLRNGYTNYSSKEHPLHARWVRSTKEGLELSPSSKSAMTWQEAIDFAKTLQVNPEDITAIKLEGWCYKEDTPKKNYTVQVEVYTPSDDLVDIKVNASSREEAIELAEKQYNEELKTGNTLLSPNKNNWLVWADKDAE